MLGRRVVTGGLVSLLALGVLSACADNDEADNDDDVVVDSTVVVAPAPAPGTVTDAQIAKIALGANSADSAAGELAKTRGTDANVKAFAQRMITDHTAANQEATQLATSANLTPEDSDMSRDMQKDADDNLQKLQGLSGKDFDKAYIDHEVDMHQHVLDDLDKNLIPNAQNAQLKQLLEKIRPTIDSHLQQARQIQEKIK